MRVLLIKTSSMGDVVHSLPALTDAAAAIPDVRFDWVVEEAFASIAGRHPAVARVIPCALRRWRRNPLKAVVGGEWKTFREQLRAEQYDAVIDAQGLLKSAFLTKRARGPKFGLDTDSAREALSARVLDHPLAVEKGVHAIQRVRRLVAAALGYDMPDSAPDYGLPRAHPAHAERSDARLLFVHGTTWATKHWPLAFWQRLLQLAEKDGHTVLLPWGSDEEKTRAERIAGVGARAEVLPRMTLEAMMDLMSELDGFVAVDTGLAHLAAASGMTGLALYGPTDPVLTGVWSVRSRSVAADFPCAPCLQRECTYRGDLGRGVEPPCFSTLPAEVVWRDFRELRNL